MATFGKSTKLCLAEQECKKLTPQCNAIQTVLFIIIHYMRVPSAILNKKWMNNLRNNKQYKIFLNTFYKRSFSTNRAIVLLTPSMMGRL